jgi:transposase InsO family protein
MNGDKSFPINPLAPHAIYTEGNMVSIATTISVGIFKTPGETITHFIFNHMVVRFGIPKEIGTDHGSHFQNKMMTELTSNIWLRKEHLSPYYPQENGQVESLNKSLKTIL